MDSSIRVDDSGETNNRRTSKSRRRTSTTWSVQSPNNTIVKVIYLSHLLNGEINAFEHMKMKKKWTCSEMPFSQEEIKQEVPIEQDLLLRAPG